MFKTSDGKTFPTKQRAMAYQSSLAEKGKQDIANAPGGNSWEHDRRAHGLPRSTSIEYDGPGRWKFTATHADGYKHQSVHPEIFRAHQVQASMYGIDEPPPGVRTQMRAKAHPGGPKEKDRLDQLDQREPEREEEQP